MVTLRINTGYASIVFEKGYDGNFVRPENSNTINVRILNELSVDCGTLAFHVVVKIPKAYTKNEKIAQSMAVSWLNQELPKQFSSQSYWDFFRITELQQNNSQDASFLELGKQEAIEFQLHQSLALQAQEALSHLKIIEERFDNAKEKLWKFATTNTPLGFAKTRGEARVVLQIIENILSAGADTGGYEASKARAALIDYEELARRKDANNFNYRSTLESLKNFAYGVYFPNSWHARPSA